MVRSVNESSNPARVILPLERIATLAQRWRHGEIDDACYAAQYFLHWQIAMHGQRFASRRYKHDPRPNHIAWMTGLEQATGNEARSILAHYFERYGFLGVIPNVCMALHAWLLDRWPLTLREYIPSPEELLRMQVRGTRAVTVLSQAPRLLQPVLNKPHAFAFMVHDLEHAYKFFHDPALHAAQMAFFSQVLRVIESGVLDKNMKDPIFVERFNYLISDMNTHAMHSLQFLRAILIECHLRAAGKQAGERLSSHAQIEVDAVMRLFDENRSLVIEEQLAANATAVQLGVRYAEGMA
jgi:hypothetical protein